MHFSLEETMITVLKNCIETSILKTTKHQKLQHAGYFTRDLFRGESWKIRTRNEPVSEEKREYLGQLIKELESIHKFNVATGKQINETFSPLSGGASSSQSVIRKSPITVKSEINFQISQFHALQVVLQKTRKNIEDTISVTAAGGESLKAVEVCETIVKAAISGWIVQMQNNNFHKNGIFPQVFESSETQNEGVLFEKYVRGLILNATQIQTGQLYDPNKTQPASELILDADISGVYSLAMITGRISAPTSQTETQDREINASQHNVLSFTQLPFLPPPPPLSPPPYNISYLSSSNINQSVQNLQDGMYDPQKIASASSRK